MIYRFLLILILISSVSTLRAQVVNRAFDFNVGEEFNKKTVVSSTGIVERGNQTIEVKTVSNVDKSIKVVNANENGFGFKITIDELDNQIESLGNKLHFNSKKPVDPTSKIEKALRFMVDKPVELQTDRSGIILSLQDPTIILANDTLLAFAGIQPEFFERGDLFTLVGDYVYDASLTKGYSWSDSLVIDEQKMVTEYVIDDINEENTVIKLKTNVSGRLINSNSNATYIVENKSGIILEKLIYSISTGFRISNKMLYAVSRSSTIVESISRKKPLTE